MAEYQKEQGDRTQDMPDPYPEANIDIVTKKKKKTGFYSLINTKIASMNNMLKTAEFDESKHPRGQPDNAGEFVKSDGGGSSKKEDSSKSQSGSSDKNQVRIDKIKELLQRMDSGKTVKTSRYGRLKKKMQELQGEAHALADDKPKDEKTKEKESEQRKRNDIEQSIDEANDVKAEKDAEKPKTKTVREENFDKKMKQYDEDLKQYKKNVEQKKLGVQAKKDLKSYSKEKVSKFKEGWGFYSDGSMQSDRRSVSSFRDSAGRSTEEWAVKEGLIKKGPYESVRTYFAGRPSRETTKYEMTAKGRAMFGKPPNVIKPQKPIKEKKIPGVKEYSREESERLQKMFKQHPDDRLFNGKTAHMINGDYGRLSIVGGPINKAFKAGDYRDGAGQLNILNKGRDLQTDGHWISDGNVLQVEKGEDTYPEASTNDGYGSEMRYSDFKVGGEMMKVGDEIEFDDGAVVRVSGFAYEGDEWEGPSVHGYVTQGTRDHPAGQEKGHGDHRTSEVRRILSRGHGVMKNGPNMKSGSLDSKLNTLKINNMKLQVSTK